MSDIVVYGTGGLGRVVMEALYKNNLKSNQYNILGFIDDNQELLGSTVNFQKVIGTRDFLLNWSEEINVVMCIGDPIIRRKIVDGLSDNKNIKFPNFISDDTNYSERLINIGIGNMIHGNCIITADCTIGSHCNISTQSSVGHDVVLEDYVVLSPGCIILGNVTIGSGTYVGAGAVIRQGLTVGKNSLVGMGSVVINDIPDNVVAFGNPCRVISNRTNNDRMF